LEIESGLGSALAAPACPPKLKVKAEAWRSRFNQGSLPF